MRISEVSKAFGISPESLRFLEAEGLIHPRRENQNAYREYSMVDYGIIMEYMTLQSFGLSIREIVAILYKNSFSDCQQILRQKHDKLKDRMKRDQLLDGYMNDFIRKLDSFYPNIGLYSFETKSTIQHISVGQASTGAEKYHGDELAACWRKNVPFVSLGYLMQPYHTSDSVRSVECILLAEQAYVELLELPMDDSVRKTQIDLFIRTYAVFCDFDSQQSIFDDIVSFAESRGYAPCGQILIILLLRLEDGMKYAEIRLPVKANHEGTSV